MQSASDRQMLANSVCSQGLENFPDLSAFSELGASRLDTTAQGQLHARSVQTSGVSSASLQPPTVLLDAQSLQGTQVTLLPRYVVPTTQSIQNMQKIQQLQNLENMQVAHGSQNNFSSQNPSLNLNPSANGQNNLKTNASNQSPLSQTSVSSGSYGCPVGQLSPLLLDHRQDMASRGYFPMGLSPNVPFFGGHNNERGFSIVSMLVNGPEYGTDYSPGPRDSLAVAYPITDTRGRIRGNSLSVPPLLAKLQEDGADVSSPKSGSWNEPSRSSSIFSSLIQLPPLTNNFISRQSSNDGTQVFQVDAKKPLVNVEFDPAARYNYWGTSYGSFAGTRRCTRAFESNLAMWDLLNRGFGGSVAGFDSISHYLAPMHNTGSVDMHSICNGLRLKSAVKIEPDLALQPPSSFPGHTLREDIFEERPPGSLRHSCKASVSDDNPLSPKSSLSSKMSRRRFEEPLSPKTLSRPVVKNEHEPYVAQPPVQPERYSGDAFGPAKLSIPPDRPSLSPRTGAKNPGNFYPYMAGAMGSSPPSSLSSNQKLKEEILLIAAVQPYAHAEDGRPPLGATKVDQLMLVIQAQKKGNIQAICQKQDGNIVMLDAAPLVPFLAESEVAESKTSEEDGARKEDNNKRRNCKALQCSYCGKVFTRSTHLEVHVRSHIGYKPYQCSVCLKRFTQGSNLQTHKRLHTGTKPFSCSVCNRSFSRKGNLAAHILTHKKVTPYKCEFDGCEKLFTQLGNLKSHQNKFHLLTLNRLTHTLATMGSDDLALLPPEEKLLLEYFAKLYKNLNKGIRGRGKTSVHDGAPPSVVSNMQGRTVRQG